MISFEITGKDKPSVALEVSSSPVSAETKEYAAAMRGNNTLLALPETVFKQIFENLDRLKEPEITPKKS